MNLKVIRQGIVGIAALVVMVLFTACAGVGTNAGASTLNLSGSVVSVDTQHDSVTVSVNGQTKTINNVPSNVLTALQGQVGKIYSFQVTQNSDGSYNIVSGTNVTPEANEGITPETNNETPSVNEPGNIQFIGNITSNSNGSIVVNMPNGSSLSVTPTPRPTWETSITPCRVSTLASRLRRTRTLMAASQQRRSATSIAVMTRPW